MGKLKYAGLMVMVFMSGGIVSNNLGRLIGTNPEYEAGWYKVAFAIFLAVFFSALAWSCAKKSKGGG